MENEQEFLGKYLQTKDGDDWFVKQFGRFYKKRESRTKSLEQIHDIWIRAEARAEARRREKSKCIDEIVKEIPKNSKGTHIVYFYWDNVIYQYEVSYQSFFKSHGISFQSVKFSSDVVTKREEKIDFILSNEKQFELGEKYRKLDRLECKKQYMVKNKFLEIIENNLKEIYKDKQAQEITIVSVGGKKYCFMWMTNIDMIIRNFTLKVSL